MREMLHAGRAVLADVASTIFFLALYALTGNIVLAVALGMALALLQIGWKLARRQAVDTLQWISLFLVIASGSTTLLTRDPVFVMLKPTAIYLLVGGTMMRRGWMTRYMPPIAVEKLPDLIVIFGYAWAGLMFFSAALNLVLALSLSVIAWGAAMAAWGTASKLALFFAQYGAMKAIGMRRKRAREAMIMRGAVTTAGL